MINVQPVPVSRIVGSARADRESENETRAGSGENLGIIREIKHDVYGKRQYEIFFLPKQGET